MIHKNEQQDQKERALAHQQLLAELGEVKTNCLRGKDMGLDLKNLDIEVEVAKFKGIRPTGYTIVVRLFTEPQHKKSGIVETDKEHADQVFGSFMGLVLSLSPDCYDPNSVDRDGNKRFPNGPWCKVGDFIIFPKSSGIYHYYNHPDGTTSPLFFIVENAPVVVVDQPDIEALKRK